MEQLLAAKNELLKKTEVALEREQNSSSEKALWSKINNLIWKFNYFWIPKEKSQIFPRNQLLKMDLMLNLPFLLSHCIGLAQEVSESLLPRKSMTVHLRAKIGRFSMSSIFKSVFLEKIWLYKRNSISYLPLWVGGFELNRSRWRSQLSNDCTLTMKWFYSTLHLWTAKLHFRLPLTDNRLRRPVGNCLFQVGMFGPTQVC